MMKFWEMEAAAAELVEHLRALIRLDTSNPGRDEWPVVAYLQGVLDRAGVRTTVVQRGSDGRPNLVARVQGSGEERPLLFLSHTDVVPASPEGWSCDPFGGDLRDGFVWGRGAVDMKHILATMLQIIVLAQRTQVPLRRDLIFAATADEETDGESGAGWLFRERLDLVDAEVVVSEGSDALVVASVPVVLLEVAEKGWVVVDLVRRSTPAHSSLPVSRNCLIDIGRILERLGERRFPHRVTRGARALVEGLADSATPTTGDRLRDLLDPTLFDESLRSLDLPDGMKTRLVGVLHSHATPTMVECQGSTWSVPESARLRLAGRVVPGTTLDDWLEELEEIIGPLGEFEVGPFAAGVESAIDSDVLESIAGVLAPHYEGARVVPTLMLGGGDLRHPMEAGMVAVSFFPLLPEPGVPSIWELAHCPDERISVANLRRCLGAGWDLLLALNR